MKLIQCKYCFLWLLTFPGSHSDLIFLTDDPDKTVEDQIKEDLRIPIDDDEDDEKDSTTVSISSLNL